MTTTETLARKIVEPGLDWVDGVCVEKDMGTRSDATAARLVIRLGAYVLQHELGDVLTQGTGYQFPELDGGRLRFPDISFVRDGRFSDEELPDGWTSFPPDLVVESVSPNDTAESVVLKGHVWLDAGVPMAWIVYPHARSVLVMRPGTQGILLGPDDELDGEDVVPGFRVRVGDIFRPASKRSQTAE